MAIFSCVKYGVHKSKRRVIIVMDSDQLNLRPWHDMIALIASLGQSLRESCNCLFLLQSSSNTNSHTLFLVIFQHSMISCHQIHLDQMPPTSLLLLRLRKFSCTLITFISRTSLELFILQRKTTPISSPLQPLLPKKILRHNNPAHLPLPYRHHRRPRRPHPRHRLG